MSHIADKLFVRSNQIIVASVASVSFVLLALDVLFDGMAVKLDGYIHLWSPAWHDPVSDKIFFALTQLGCVPAMLFLTLAVTLVMLYQKRYAGSLLFWGGMLGAWAAFVGLKELIARPRPHNLISHSYAFPSGHAAMSTAFALLLFLLFYRRVTGVYRVALALFCMLFPLSISWSRVYLGVHWLSDVLGGMLLGIFWVLTVVLIFDSKLINQVSKH
jgi:undecaprenyl-diphosphatase